jgi:hypothetical protein
MKIQWPDQPEYLQMFSNEGPVKVMVRFSAEKEKHRAASIMDMHWKEFDRLIDPETGALYTSMYLDTHLCPIKRYEIDPASNSLTIVIAKTDLP